MAHRVERTVHLISSNGDNYAVSSTSACEQSTFIDAYLCLSNDDEIDMSDVAPTALRLLATYLGHPVLETLLNTDQYIDNETLAELTRVADEFGMLALAFDLAWLNIERCMATVDQGLLAWGREHRYILVVRQHYRATWSLHKSLAEATHNRILDDETMAEQFGPVVMHKQAASDEPKWAERMHNGLNGLLGVAKDGSIWTYHTRGGENFTAHLTFTTSNSLSDSHIELRTFDDAVHLQQQAEHLLSWAKHEACTVGPQERFDADPCSALAAFYSAGLERAVKLWVEKRADRPTVAILSASHL